MQHTASGIEICKPAGSIFCRRTGEVLTAVVHGPSKDLLVPRAHQTETGPGTRTVNNVSLVSKKHVGQLERQHLNEQFGYYIVSTKKEEHKLCYQSAPGKETGDQGRPLRGSDILIRSFFFNCC